MSGNKRHLRRPGSWDKFDIKSRQEYKISLRVPVLLNSSPSSRTGPTFQILPISMGSVQRTVPTRTLPQDLTKEGYTQPIQHNSKPDNLVL